MGRQLDRLMPLWQPVNILHSVLIFMLLWQINIVVVVVRHDQSSLENSLQLRSRNDFGIFASLTLILTFDLSISNMQRGR